MSNPTQAPTGIGALIRHRREELGLSVERCAVTADVSSTTLSRLERFNAVPKYPLLVRIARVLDLDPVALYTAAAAAS